MIEDAVRNWWHKYSPKIQNSHWIWLVPTLGVFLDSFILIIPSDLLLIMALLSCPAKWKRIFTGTLFGATGALLILYFLMNNHDLQASFAGHVSQWSWGGEQAAEYFNKYGVWSLVLVAFTPLPAQVPVMLCALTGITWWQVALGVILGRSLRYGLFVFGILSGKKVYEHYHSPKANSQ